MAVIEEKKIGAVMVVGAGIAGIQAALDLAESGYYVFWWKNRRLSAGLWPN